MPVKKPIQSPPCTGPCGMQSVVQKVRGVHAKVVTLLSTVSDFHPVLSEEW